MSSKEWKLTDAQLLRIKAEKLLEQKHSKIKKPVIEADVNKLLHELQVHQIELEMQNEELRLANETAEVALKKYTMLYDFAPTGYFTLDSDGSVRDLNFTGAEMLGEKRFTVENSNFKLFISDESKLVFDKFFTKVFSGMGKESCEIILGQDNNTLRTVYIEGIVIADDRKCLLSVVDITSFKNRASLIKKH
jgi:PAS domain-containing protein